MHLEWTGELQWLFQISSVSRVYQHWIRSLILVSLFDNQSLCTISYTWLSCATSLGSTPSKAEAEKRTQLQVVYWTSDFMTQEWRRGRVRQQRGKAKIRIHCQQHCYRPQGLHSTRISMETCTECLPELSTWRVGSGNLYPLTSNTEWLRVPSGGLPP